MVDGERVGTSYFSIYPQDNWFFMLIVLGAASLFFGIGSHKKAFPELHPKDKKCM